MSNMVSEKILRFQNKNKDPAQVAQQIEQQLKAEGYKTQSKVAPLGTIVQAQKAAYSVTWSPRKGASPSW